MTRRRRNPYLEEERSSLDPIAAAAVVGVLGLALLVFGALVHSCQGPGPALGRSAAVALE